MTEKEEKSLITFNVIGRYNDGTEGSNRVEAKSSLEVWLKPHQYGFSAIYRMYPVLPDKRGS